MRTAEDLRNSSFCRIFYFILNGLFQNGYFDIFWGPCRTPCDKKRRSPETLNTTMIFPGPHPSFIVGSRVPDACRDAPCPAPIRSLIHLLLLLLLPPLEASPNIYQNTNTATAATIIPATTTFLQESPCLACGLLL